jgi:HlyD family secretion protein
MTANVSIIVAERTNVLRLANSALRVRLPDELVPKPTPPTVAAPAGAAAAPAAQPMTDQERRAARFQILQEVGYTRGNGPPSPDILQKAQQRAKEKGLDLDFSQFGGSRGNSGAGVITTRTVYRLIGTDPKTAKLEAVSAKLGITDNLYTEVTSGLKEGDVIVTSVTMAGGSSTSAARPAANPFAGSPGGPRR